MVAALIILPMILRHYKHEQHEEQNNRPAQVTENNNSAATTTPTVQTIATTTAQTHSESQAHITLNVLCSKSIVTTTRKEVTSQSSQTSVDCNLQTTETETSKTTTTKKAVQTTTTSTVANNVPVEKQGYYPTKEEWDMFCVVVCSETGYCEDKAQLAVAHTVINRLSNPIYPNTIKEILTQRAQYTCVQNYYTGNMRPGLEVGGEAYNHTMQLVHQAWKEWDFTHGAVAYYNPHMIGWNAWFEQYECVYEDQYGRFFKV